MIEVTKSIPVWGESSGLALPLTKEDRIGTIFPVEEGDLVIKTSSSFAEKITGWVKVGENWLAQPMEEIVISQSLRNLFLELPEEVEGTGYRYLSPIQTCLNLCVQALSVHDTPRAIKQFVSFRDELLKDLQNVCHDLLCKKLPGIMIHGEIHEDLNPGEIFLNRKAIKALAKASGLSKEEAITLARSQPWSIWDGCHKMVAFISHERANIKSLDCDGDILNVAALLQMLEIWSWRFPVDKFTSVTKETRRTELDNSLWFEQPNLSYVMKTSDQDWFQDNQVEVIEFMARLKGGTPAGASQENNVRALHRGESSTVILGNNPSKDPGWYNQDPETGEFKPVEFTIIHDYLMGAIKCYMEMNVEKGMWGDIRPQDVAEALDPFRKGYKGVDGWHRNRRTGDLFWVNGQAQVAQVLQFLEHSREHLEKHFSKVGFPGIDPIEAFRHWIAMYVHCPLSESQTWEIMQLDSMRSWRMTPQDKHERILEVMAVKGPEVMAENAIRQLKEGVPL